MQRQIHPKRLGWRATRVMPIDHLGKYEEAEKWLTEAVNQHETLAEQEPNRSTLRELGASAAMLATMQLSRIASDETFDTPKIIPRLLKLFVTD